MLSRAIFISLLVAPLATAELVPLLRDAELSLTCLRQGNECLEMGEGNYPFSLLQKAVAFTLEEQEISMDQMEPDDGKNHWVFDGGKWKLEHHSTAENERGNAKKDYDEEKEKQNIAFRRSRRTLAKNHKNALAELEMELMGVDMMVDSTELDQVIHEDGGRELWYYDDCSGVHCSGQFCMMFCYGGRNRRQRERRNLRAADAETLEKANSRELWVDDLCVWYTNLEDFLKERNIPDLIEDCVNKETLCQIAHPCSV